MKLLSVALLLIFIMFLFIFGCITPPTCGNGVCEVGETFENCQEDCGTSAEYCGDGICQENENYETCSKDCDKQINFSQAYLEITPSIFRLNKDIQIEMSFKSNIGEDLTELVIDQTFFSLTDITGNTEIFPATQDNNNKSIYLTPKISQLNLVPGKINISSKLVTNGFEFSANGEFLLIDANTFNCEKVFGSNETNNNILIASSNYSSETISIFESESEKYYNSLISKKPFLQNLDRFNIYLLTSFEDIHPNPGQGILESDYLEFENICNVPLTTILVIERGGNSAHAGGKIGFVSEHILENPNSDSTITFLHEFGHAFGGLGEEYVAMRYENNTQIQYFENQDIEFCPKWCSGKPNITNECYQRYVDFQECTANDKSNQNIINCFGTDMDYILSCNIGTDCPLNAGCYLGADTLSRYKSFVGGIMDSPNIIAEYGPVNESILLRKLNNQ